MVQVEIHVPMESPEPEVPIVPYIPDEDLEPVRELLIPKGPAAEEPVVPEPIIIYKMPTKTTRN